MSEISNKEFNELLNSLATSETFSLELTDGQSYTFRQLTTNQLKELIKTVVDSPLTQSAFNTTISKVMKESIVEEGISVSTFNTVDRLLFCLSTRIESLSPSLTITQENESIEVNLLDVRNNISKAVKENSHLFTSQSVISSNGTVELTYGIPTIGIENQLNDEFYKNTDISVETPNELRKVLGEAFINEIAKTIQTITINTQTLDLNAGSFKSRLKTVESLPASLIQKVIEFAEQYKKVTDEPLTVKEKYTVPIDGSLFSLR